MKGSGVDISNVGLDGKEERDVEVYDTCDKMRKKISAHLTKDGVTQAQFCRDLTAQLHGTGKVSASQLTAFRGKKGANAGATSSTFYAAYVFFEKIRLATGKPKSKHRLEMEDAWPSGFDLEHDANTRYDCNSSFSASQDIHFAELALRSADSGAWEASDLTKIVWAGSPSVEECLTSPNHLWDPNVFFTFAVRTTTCEDTSCQLARSST